MTKPNTTKPTVTLASSVALPEITEAAALSAETAKIKGDITGYTLAHDVHAAFEAGVKAGKKRANDELSRNIPPKDASPEAYRRWMHEQRARLNF